MADVSRLKGSTRFKASNVITDLDHLEGVHWYFNGLPLDLKVYRYVTMHSRRKREGYVEFEQLVECVWKSIS